MSFRSLVRDAFGSFGNKNNAPVSVRTINQRASFVEKGDQSTVAELENGPLRRNQLYKMLGADRSIHHYIFVCECGTDTGIPNGITSHVNTYLCANCSRPFRVEDWLKADMQARRAINGPIKPAEVTKTQTFPARPYTEEERPYTADERQIADNRIPTRWVHNPQTQQRNRQDAIERQLDGGMHGPDYATYGQDNPDSGGTGFNDPHAMQASGRTPNTAQQHAAYSAYVEERTNYIHQGRTPEQQAMKEQRQRERDEAYQRDIDRR